MKIFVVGCLCAVAVSAAFADFFVIGKKATMAYYPWRGC